MTPTDIHIHILWTDVRVAEGVGALYALQNSFVNVIFSNTSSLFFLMLPFGLLNP